jgi:hypothetical protein
VNIRTGRWSTARLTLVQRFALFSFLVFLLLGSATGFVLSRTIESQALDAARQNAYDTLQGPLLRHITPADLASPMSPARQQQFARFLKDSVLSDRVVRVKVWNPGGTVVYSNDPRIVGQKYFLGDNPQLAQALTGKLSSEVSDLQNPENADERGFGRLLEVYIPIRFTPGGAVDGAFEVYQTYAPVASQIMNVQRSMYMMLGIGLLLLYLLLFGIVRNGSNTIVRQERELRRYVDDLEESYRQTITSLAAAVDARDHTTEEHAERVTEMVVALGRQMELPDEEVRNLERGALLHDVGKIGIRDSILLKPGSLTPEEWQEMKRHPEIGYRMLRNVSFLAGALPIIRHHHERWDGTGYPDRLRGESIPLGARLFAVVDAYDAITANRPYRAGLPHEVAMWRLRIGAGSHFDPEMVEAFENMMRANGETVPETAPAPVEITAAS